MKKLFLLLLVFTSACIVETKAQQEFKQAPAPMFRDPIYDGAADPVIVWNKQEKKWWMFYTARRANAPSQDVSAYYGTKIGIACSDNNGRNWYFRGYLDLEFERGWNTFWAPDIIEHNGKYYMFVTYIRGVQNHWNGTPSILRYESQNLWDWQYKAPLKLDSNDVIDATLLKMDNGVFRMWYRDNGTKMSESKDLINWSKPIQAITNETPHEGPKAFKFKGYYWLLTDEWQGMRIHRSIDGNTWERQGLILDKPSSREDDTPSGAHGDVVIAGDKAFVVYFTHPGRKKHGDAIQGQSFHDNHRTTIQVAPLEFVNGTLTADREKPFDFYLPNR